MLINLFYSLVNQRIKGCKTLIQFSLILAVFSCKTAETPPDEIIAEAKQHTQTILEKVKTEKNEVEGPIELIDEYYNGYSKQYVLEYHIENKATPTVKDIRKAYIVRKGDQWHYEFEFDKKYTFALPKEK